MKPILSIAWQQSCNHIYIFISAPYHKLTVEFHISQNKWQRIQTHLHISSLIMKSEIIISAPHNKLRVVFHISQTHLIMKSEIKTGHAAYFVHRMTPALYTY